uniref:Uncharacterized protein n=1 Tax=Oryza sativa subsp. japonica TaxID=39947 RepID=Q2QV85_ORYSJ|nr:hypothetical protein LOC_Os12g13680 [Oryza sativa Japonica Group]
MELPNLVVNSRPAAPVLINVATAREEEERRGAAPVVLGRDRPRPRHLGFGRGEKGLGPTIGDEILAGQSWPAPSAGFAETIVPARIQAKDVKTIQAKPYGESYKRRWRRLESRVGTPNVKASWAKASRANYKDFVMTSSASRRPNRPPPFF